MSSGSGAGKKGGEQGQPPRAFAGNRKSTGASAAPPEGNEGKPEASFRAGSGATGRLSKREGSRVPRRLAAGRGGTTECFTWLSHEWVHGKHFIPNRVTHAPPPPPIIPTCFLFPARVQSEGTFRKACSPPSLPTDTSWTPLICSSIPPK